jgi:hypothetical protein
LVLREAVEMAWSMYLATHREVDTADQRLCSLSRYLSERLNAGEVDVEELACDGLAYLDRLPEDAW